MGDREKAKRWVKVIIDIMIEAMTVIKYNKDYANCNHINYDEKIPITETTFKKVKSVIFERNLCTEEDWPYTITHMKTKWLALRKQCNKGLKLSEKTGIGTTEMIKTERDSLEMLQVYPKIGDLIKKTKPSICPPGAIDSSSGGKLSSLPDVKKPIRPPVSHRVGRKKINQVQKQKDDISRGLLKEITLANKNDQQKMKLKLMLQLKSENPTMSPKELIDLVNMYFKLTEEVPEASLSSAILPVVQQNNEKIVSEIKIMIQLKIQCINKLC